MAPFVENENNEDAAEQAIRDHLALYIEHEYTEEMYREHAGDIFALLHNRYVIEHPEIAVRRLNTYRAVIVEYVHQIPLFEIEGFGM
jgi:hypothetical protein